MKFALVIPDGCADEPQSSLGGKTALQAARIPNMDQIARLGVVGRADNVPASMPSGSDVATMSLFGYDPLACHTGRAPLEAAAQGIELGPDEYYDAVILATPANVAGTLLEGVDAELAQDLMGITYSSSVTVTLGYYRDQLNHLPPGFGFLVPRSEGTR